MDHAKPLRPEHLLEYDPVYRVLICKSCRYAVQHTGIARHLKEIHRIYRSHRRQFIEYAARFKLASPEEVIRSKIDHFPVRLLPVLDGLRCLGSDCRFLCVSTKRMQGHWLSAHGRHGSAVDNEWRFAPLQTFFRGNLLHYFTGTSSKQILDVDDTTTQPIRCDDVLICHSQLDDFDQSLLSHYISTTSTTLVDRHGTLDVWQKTIPQMAHEHPFLMHTILACSALHLAHSSPSQRPFFLLQARSHQDIAMPLFRHAIANVSASNCHAVLAFSHLLIVYSFAANSADEPLFFTNPASPSQGMLCSWLYFVRNGCLLVCEQWDRIETGPLGPLARSWEMPIPGVQEETQSALTDYLLSILPGNSDIQDEEPWFHSACEIYRETAAQLGWAFATSQALTGNDFTTWDLIRVWPMVISPEFIELLVQEHPAALILLAHYCLLLERIQPQWYFEGRATMLLNTVLERLDRQWHPFVLESLEQMGSDLSIRNE
ncbi:hypothetical protein EDB81DRAFT_285424 [Dactylonectria macrodidyma]|uniref:C2H2-type domain-containing protein n=1 Tax=Dactylonectria macrodidyma TaxID=307937 RepID=A0A9P9FP18_9HYPO|nr:hypothetical protein EDB81DRAFT_285424 [Dactylonectria macrodidyma]